MGNYFWVALGGALGSMARYALSNATAAISATIPWGTIIVNILGSFVIGWFATLSSHESRFAMSQEARVFVMVGICGGFTTFSAFSLDTALLWERGQASGAAIYVIASVLLSIAACFGGLALIRSAS